MDKITAVIVSWQAFLLAFAAFAIIGVVRNMGTKKENGVVVGGWAQSNVFKMLLPLTAYVICLGLVFVPGIPLPAELPATVGAKVLYAIWCGWFSDKSYQVIKSILEKGFGVKFADSTAPVAPPAPTIPAPAAPEAEKPIDPAA